MGERGQSVEGGCNSKSRGEGRKVREREKAEDEGMERARGGEKRAPQ